MRKLINNYN